MNYCLCVESEYNGSELYEFPADVFPVIGGVALRDWEDQPRRVAATYCKPSHDELQRVLELLGQDKPYRAVHYSDRFTLDYDAPAPKVPF